MRYHVILSLIAWLFLVGNPSAQTGIGSAPGAGYGPISTTTGPIWGRTGGLNVKSYGAICDGVTDDSAAINAAVTDSSASSGTPVYLPGFCAIASPINFTAGYAGIVGTGPNSGLRPIIGTTAININAVGSVYLDNFAIIYPSIANMGTEAINVSAPSGENVGSVFNRLEITNANYGINFVKASKFTVSNNIISAYRANAISVSNTNNPDSGDSAIYNNQIGGVGGAVGGAAIYWQSSGGIRINNNKINVAPVGIQIALASAATTTGVYIIGNSIEGIDPAIGITGSGAAIQLGRQGATGQLSNVIVAANELVGNFGVYAPVDANGVWLTGLTVTGGTFQGNPGVSVAAVEVDSVNGFNVTGITVIPSAGGTTYPGIIGSAASNGSVGPLACAGVCQLNSIAAPSTIPQIFGTSGAIPLKAATGVAATDTAIIQNAINALPVNGGELFAPCGSNYNINATINIGNGTSSGVSTRNGVIISGNCAIPGYSITAFDGWPAGQFAGVRFTWSGAGAGTMFKINGGVDGWGFNNIIFDCNNSAAVGLENISGENGKSSNLTVLGCTSVGYLSTTVPDIVSGGVYHTDALRNKFYGMTVSVPAGAIGIYLDGENSTLVNPSDTDFNQFDVVQIVTSNAGGAGTGIKFRNADSNIFNNVACTLNKNSDICITFDYTGINPSLPTGNIIQNIDWGVTPTNPVTTTGSSSGRHNNITGVIGTNGGIPSFAVDGVYMNDNSVQMGGGKSVQGGLGTFNGGLAATLPASAGAGGLYVCVDAAGVFYKKATCP